MDVKYSFVRVEAWETGSGLGYEARRMAEGVEIEIFWLTKVARWSPYLPVTCVEPWLGRLHTEMKCPFLTLVEKGERRDRTRWFRLEVSDVDNVDTHRETYVSTSTA